jgi:ComF family protein
MFARIAEYPNDFYRLFFPKICGSCDATLVKGEHHLCLHCRTELPFTNFENIKNNPVEKLFYGRANIEFATSLFFFSQTEKVQNILHNIKYNEQKELAIHIGKIFGERLKNNSYLDSVTTIVPVPLHPQKEHLRGYNQSTLFAEGLNEVLGKELQDKNLIRVVNTSTQTKKNRLERAENVENAFVVKNPAAFKDKHVLLVDDVLTTGATLEACAQVLLEQTNCKVSIATIACVLS